VSRLSRKFRSRILSLLLIVCSLLLASCDGLKSCSSTALVGGFVAVNWTYSCNATYSEIAESQEVSFNFDEVNETLFGGVDTALTISVESGSVQVTFLDENNFLVVLNVEGGESVNWSGRARVFSGPRVNMDITPIGGKAGNVRYEVTFSG